MLYPARRDRRGRRLPFRELEVEAMGLMQMGPSGLQTVEPRAMRSHTINLQTIVLNWIANVIRLLRRGASKPARLEPSSTGADNDGHELETSDRALARRLPGEAGPHPPRPDSEERGG